MNELYKVYSNPAKVNKIVRQEVESFMVNFRKDFNPLLNLAAASPKATTTDAEIFNFTIGRAKQKRQVVEIKTSIHTLITPIVGGNLILRNRTDTSSKTDRIPLELGANSVQVVYTIDKVLEKLTDAAKMVISTKAKFVIETGVENTGKKLFGYSRWYNTKHPHLSGPWKKWPEIYIA